MFHKNKKLAYCFLLPQLLITVIFFVWPAIEAIIQSIYFSDAFGLQRHFAGLTNFIDLFKSKEYLNAIWVTFVLAFSIAGLTIALGLWMAVLVNARTKNKGFYKTLLLWPYAIAPAVAAILWRFLCHPTLGWLTKITDYMGYDFNILTHPNQALAIIICAASWQQFSYNFIFYLAALKLIPKPLIEAAIIDGAGPWRRFWEVIFPLLSPTTFFLMTMNLIYSFFDTFGIIQVITNGGPEYSTTNLMFKVYQDGFIAMDPGSSSAQSVILMAIVIGLTMLQFKLVEKKVHYQ